MNSATDIKTLSVAEKKALLAQLLSKKKKEPISAPLSFTQQRLWFLDQLLGETPNYNIPAAVRIRGAIQYKALERALNELVMRHESLRTTFPTVNDEPVQSIAPPDPFQLPVEVVEIYDDPLAYVQRFAHTEGERPMNLAEGPLWRANLFKLGPNDHVLFLVMHHIISDGWSMGVFIRELTMLYLGFSRGLTNTLPKLKVQYADYAKWQQDWFEGPEPANQIEYWQKQLADAPDLLTLPLDYPRPAVQSFNGQVHRFVLPDHLTQKISRLNRQLGTTSFMVYLAAFSVLLARYSGQTDILVGTPVANRNRIELEALIGYFANTLIMRTQLADNPTFMTLIERVRNIALDAFANQEVPFEKIVEALQPVRNLSHSPLFQVMLVLQNAPAGELSLPGLEMTSVDFEHTTAKFDLLLTLAEDNGKMVGALEYNSDLFAADTAKQMARHFEALLSQLLDTPERPVLDVPILLPAEKRRLSEWNETRVPYPADVCLHDLVTAQARRTPEAPAVVMGDERLTYRQLNERANQVAHYLQRFGIGPDRCVGVFMERSLDMVVALLAVLKAGGAYIPLDPGYPEERLGYMLDNSQVAVVLTSGRLKPALTHLLLDPEAVAILCLDQELEAAADLPLTEPESEVTPENLAYVLYTSGSTGQPKGAMLPHRAIVNHMQWFQNRFQLDARDVVLQKTPFSFDASVWEFYAPLLVGGVLALAVPDGHRDGAYLVEAIQKHRVTVIQLVPTQLQLLLSEKSFADCRSLRYVFCGGEILPRDFQRRFEALLPADLINLYGPTEACIDTTYWVCKRGEERGAIPIGRPIDNVQLYVLDEKRALTPIGIPGELYISGAGLATGYLNRPDLTEGRFVPHPFSAAPGERLYRTGDLVRFRHDGALEFLGRLDDQVKLRGFRIELGEIESALRQHPGVREAAAAVWTFDAEDKRLAAYLVVEDVENEPTVEELRSYLQDQLPSYMVPTLFTWLDFLPQTANGKINRRALPEPDRSRQLQTEFVAPRTAMESTLADIWAEILKVEQVGVHDNFFDLGGHSLLVVQFVARLRDELLIELPIPTLFIRPTISELTENIHNIQQTLEKINAAPEVMIDNREEITL
ncbi:MAG: amino acid adenylation domain-containing protein [Ardenticatenaceae bacterium]|nr:amino acid adenylation domain-containing protein [Ardenticatenaceae bacterium]